MPTQGKGNRLDASEMMMRLALPCFVFFLVFICAKNVANADHWCYKDIHCDARTWEGECRTGKQQSPIDFNEKNTKVQPNTPVRLRFNKNYTDVQNRFWVKNNGHTIQVQLDDRDLTSGLLFDGDFLKGSYRFSQLHFHWGSHQDTGSEHTVNGNGYVAELHLVHYSNEYKSLGDAAASKNRRGLAVLGIFFEISSQTNHALQPIVDAISKVGESTSTLNQVSSPLNISALLPDELSFWRYYGSLTTPSCNEVVHWTVFKKAVPISRAQWQQFLASKDANEDILEDNFRPTQPTLYRKALLFETVHRIMMPGPGEPDRDPPKEDTFFEKAQKDIVSKSTGTEEKDMKPENNGANSHYGSLLDHVITGFMLLSVILQILLQSILRCL